MIQQPIEYCVWFGVKARTIVIILFLVGISLQFVFGREDWPLSGFGMYNESIADYAYVKFEVEVSENILIGNSSEVDALKYDFEDLLSELFGNRFRENKDSDSLMLEMEQFIHPRTAMWVENLKIDPGKGVKVRLHYWSKINRENSRRPDRTLVVYDSEF